ncbi:hypothetical protein MTR67_001486 [Solanum verrucosum]|uniref:Retrotransposon gag domain-containing protein n=1 Tax=Solanum verrucosum TaxID=315347 RepID=A0AAF0PNT7_SOLVR|nr:hypothetical protein MTR67_001486 [Solanum verrucosum]
MGFTSSVSGFHSLTESNQKLLQALRSQVTSMHSQPSPVELGRFNGYNAVGWVLQVELYFDFYAISNAHKLHYVSSYFDGDALEWFHWMSRNNQLVDWKYFKEQVVLRFQNSTVTTPMGILVDTFQAHFDYARYASMVPPVTQVFSFVDLNIIPTYCKFESTSKVGKSNAEQVFDEMPLAENSPFSSNNEVVMSLEGFAATTEAHLLNECSQQSNHKVFVDEQFDVTTFSSEGHSDLEDEVSEEVCHIQAQFEGSMSVVQQTLVVNNQEFVPEDFAAILENIQINAYVSTTGPIAKCASDLISHCSCLFTYFNSYAPSYVTGRHNKFELSGEKLPLDQVLHTCCHKRTCAYLYFELEPILDILLFGSVVDAWVDTGQLSYSLSNVAETPHRFYNKLGWYPCMWNRSYQQLFDNPSQTCDCSKEFAEDPKGKCNWYAVPI